MIGRPTLFSSRPPNRAATEPSALFCAVMLLSESAGANRGCRMSDRRYAIMAWGLATRESRPWYIYPGEIRMGKPSSLIAGIEAAFIKLAGYFFWPRTRPSGAAARAGVESEVVETSVESAVVETGVESAVAEHEAASEAERVQPNRLGVASAISPDQQEIRRRRDLVRGLFNDFWNGTGDKPLTFVDRLNQAEPYLNERLSALGEPWQLDANSRKLLGLPPRAH